MSFDRRAEQPLEPERSEKLIRQMRFYFMRSLGHLRTEGMPSQAAEDDTDLMIDTMNQLRDRYGIDWSSSVSKMLDQIWDYNDVPDPGRHIE
jgi:hypothetical protein